MKKKIIAQLLLLVMVMACVAFPALAGGLTPENPSIVRDNTSGTGMLGWSDSYKFQIQDGYLYAISYDYTVPQGGTTETNSYIGGTGAYLRWRDTRSTDYGWCPVSFTPDGIVANKVLGNVSGNTSVNLGEAKEGETYSVYGVMNADECRIFINSVEVYSGAYNPGKKFTEVPYNGVNGAHAFYVSPHLKAKLELLQNTTLDDFEVPQVISQTDDVIVTPDETSEEKSFHNFKVTIKDKNPVTVSELFEKLQLPEGADAKVLQSGNEVSGATVIESDMEFCVASKNGLITKKYVIIAGISLIRSGVYSVSNVDKTISGLLRYTPVEKLLESIETVSAQEISGVTPSGDFVKDGMKLEVLDDEGECVYYTLVLNEAWTEFENYGGMEQIRKLQGKIVGKKTLISGCIDIPAVGLSENQGLYLNMDIDRGNVIEFNKDGSLNVWGNNIGKWKAGESYSYNIITDPANKKCYGYINGVKILSGAVLSGNYNNESDPYELVGGSYNPCDYGDFILSEIYSVDAFEEDYKKSSVNLSATGENAGVVVKSIDELVITLFADESYTVNDLENALTSAEGASVSYFGKTGQEISDLNTLISDAAYLTVTSADGLYTGKYEIVISQDVLRSDKFTVSNAENTIGDFMHFTPVSVLLNSITVRPDWNLVGVFRGEEQITDDVICAGDILRLEKNEEYRDYTLQMKPDLGNLDSIINIAGGTVGTVTVVEGNFTVPSAGVTESAYLYFKNETTGAEAWFFNIRPQTEETMGTFTVWGKQLCFLEAGKAYEYAIVNKHAQAKADIYLNGVLMYKDVSTSTSMAPTTQFEQLRKSGTLIARDTTFRFYQIYSVDTYRYVNNLTLTSSSCDISYNPNVINVKETLGSIQNLIDKLNFPSESAKTSVKVYGNEAEITDFNTKLVSDMTLTLTAEGGREGSYRINVASSPVTSYVFDVSGTEIRYNGNLSYYDFVRYCVLADGCNIKVTTAGGAEVTSGNLADGMKAIAGGKTYTIRLTGTSALPTVAITDAIEDEIVLTNETFEKTVEVSGAGIQRVTVYFDGEATILGTSEGNYTFSESGLTIGRHEFYAEVLSDNGKSETTRYALFAFDNETERLRAAQRPVVMEINYLNGDDSVLPATDKISYTDTAKIELIFNKAIQESTVNKNNIRLLCAGTTAVDYDVSYVTDGQAYYAAIVTLDSQLLPSTQYQLVTDGAITDADGNMAEDDALITFTTSPTPFDAYEQRIVDENGSDITTLSGGDSAAIDVTFANTTAQPKEGVIVLAVFDGNRMVGYSVTPYTIEAGAITKTVKTQTASIEHSASQNLIVYRYIWDDVNDMNTLLKQYKINFN